MSAAVMDHRKDCTMTPEEFRHIRAEALSELIDAADRQRVRAVSYLPRRDEPARRPAAVRLESQRSNPASGTAQPIDCSPARLSKPFDPWRPCDNVERQRRDIDDLPTFPDPMTNCACHIRAGGHLRADTTAGGGSHEDQLDGCRPHPGRQARRVYGRLDG